MSFLDRCDRLGDRATQTAPRFKVPGGELQQPLVSRDGEFPDLRVLAVFLLSHIADEVSVHDAPFSSVVLGS